MAAAANYAWANRQMILHAARREFVRMFGIEYESMPLVYDVAHNVAKIEEHTVEGQKARLCVHRKGATRSFGPGAPDLPGDLAAIGQPVIIPGSMGTSSYVLKGNCNGDGAHLWQHLPRIGAGDEPFAGKEELTGKEVARPSSQPGHHRPGAQ